DQSEILEPRFLLHDPARLRLRVRRPDQPDRRMIVYLVELEMDAALRDEYLAWLRGHVAEMRAFPGFLGADILAPVDPLPAEGRGILYAQYRLRDRRLAGIPYRARSADAGG